MAAQTTTTKTTTTTANTTKTIITTSGFGDEDSGFGEEDDYNVVIAAEVAAEVADVAATLDMEEENWDVPWYVAAARLGFDPRIDPHIVQDEEEDCEALYGEPEHDEEEDWDALNGEQMQSSVKKMGEEHSIKTFGPNYDKWLKWREATYSPPEPENWDD